MMTPRVIFRIFLVAAGIFLLGSSSGMARPAHSPSDATVQARLPVIIKKFAFGNGTVTGTVLNASLPGMVVAGAQVCWEAKCDIANTDGIYTLHNVPSGLQTLTASADGFVTIDQTANIVGNTVNTQDIAIIPEVAKSGLNYRILATWGSQPCWPDPHAPYDCFAPYKGWWNDLDAHMWMTEISQPVGYHIGFYYHYNPADDTNEMWLDKGDCRGFPNACLERDATLGPGPETIAIRESELSIYYFGMLNFNQGNPGVPPISQTGATVHLYGITGLIRTYNVPANQGDRNFWYVFSLNGQTGEVTDQNCVIDYTNDPPVCP